MNVCSVTYTMTSLIRTCECRVLWLHDEWRHQCCHQEPVQRPSAVLSHQTGSVVESLSADQPTHAHTHTHTHTHTQTSANLVQDRTYTTDRYTGCAKKYHLRSLADNSSVV